VVKNCRSDRTAFYVPLVRTTLFGNKLPEINCLSPDLFCGARGLALWSSEPKRQGQYYHTLPVFMSSLGRISDLSAKIAAAKLMPDKTAHVFWKAKRPLIRRIRVSADEWIILAVNP
jgi:hypothetical protein